jgi:hypothetical protein
MWKSSVRFVPNELVKNYSENVLRNVDGNKFYNIVCWKMSRYLIKCLCGDEIYFRVEKKAPKLIIKFYRHLEGLALQLSAQRFTSTKATTTTQ